MQVDLSAFRALVMAKAGEVKAVGEKNGFRVEVGQAQLETEQGQPRVFKNLTTLARFVKAQGVSSLTLNLAQMPKVKKASAKIAAMPVKKALSKKTPATV